MHLSSNYHAYDSLLLKKPFILQVSNAQEELLRWHAENAKNTPTIIHATERCAAGIIQAIGHFNLGPNTSPRDVPDLSACKLENVNIGHEIVKFYLFYERWRRGEVENSELSIANLKAVCVCSYILLFSIYMFLNVVRSVAQHVYQTTIFTSLKYVGVLDTFCSILLNLLTC